MGPQDSANVQGIWISFEGTEGCGKSTQLALLARQLTDDGRTVVRTREPGGTEMGQALRGLLLRPSEQPMAAETELLLYTADRAQHLTEVILPALERGATVLCDRFLDATLAYQGYGRGLDLQTILRLHSFPPLDQRPRRTVWIELDPEEALLRARKRDTEDGRADEEGRFEAEELAFHRRVWEGYRALANENPERIRVVDGRGSKAAVQQRLRQAVEDLWTEPT